MKKLPEEVIDAKNYFLKKIDNDLFIIADKLIINPPIQVKEDLKHMWCEYLKNPPKITSEIKPIKFSDDVTKFLNEQRQIAQRKYPEMFTDPPICRQIHDLLNLTKKFIDLPIFHKKTIKDRENIALEIDKLSKRLVHLLDVNELDVLFHDISSDGGLIYIDSSPSLPYVPAANLITSITSRASQLLINSPVNAKMVKNHEAIKFARRFINHNNMMYGRTFNSRVATITNAIYGTQFDKTTITQLKNRRVGKDR